MFFRLSKFTSYIDEDEYPTLRINVLNHLNSKFDIHVEDLDSLALPIDSQSYNNL